MSELLIAQGYFLTDLYVKLTMPELRPTEGWYAKELKPTWALAVDAVVAANARSADTKARLRDAALRHVLIGRVADAREGHLYVANLILVTAIALIALTGVAMVTWWGLRILVNV